MSSSSFRQRLQAHRASGKDSRVPSFSNISLQRLQKQELLLEDSSRNPEQLLEDLFLTVPCYLQDILRKPRFETHPLLYWGDFFSSADV